MPIRAASDQGDIHAFALGAGQWAELKATYRGLNLHMPCCGVAAVPKTSTRGNYFFAHARRGECATADESPEHLYCKSLIAKAALDAGWDVTTERPGVSPAGESWVADVFCEKGRTKLALEVQMSPQADEETIRRQQRYEDSGVWGAWFFGDRARRETLAFDGKTPAFRLRPLVVGVLPTMEHFGVRLPDFVAALLQKRVTWSAPKLSRPHLVESIEDVCWACKAPIKQVLEHMHGGSAEDPELAPEDFYAGRWDPPAYTVASLSNSLEAVQSDVTNAELAAQGLNLIGRQDVIHGKPTRFPYCNRCLHCRAPQNNFHLLDHRCQGTQQTEIVRIPREVKGRGTWVLREPPVPATP